MGNSVGVGYLQLLELEKPINPVADFRYASLARAEIARSAFLFILVSFKYRQNQRGSV